MILHWCGKFGRLMLPDDPTFWMSSQFSMSLMKYFIGLGLALKAVFYLYSLILFDLTFLIFKPCSSSNQCTNFCLFSWQIVLLFMQGTHVDALEDRTSSLSYNHDDLLQGLSYVIQKIYCEVILTKTRIECRFH